jgi:serine/threonine protein kinase
MAIRHCPFCGEPIKPGDQVCSKTGKLLPFVTDTISPGTILHSRYEILKLLHSGGMGYVYLAIDKKLQRQCVVKQVKESVKSEAHLKKLEAEALQMAQLSHPNVAMVLDHFVEKPYYYLVVEYISGKTLSQVLEERHGELSEGEVINWAIAICDVVSYVHKKGDIHRDISPDNIMLTEEGFLKLVDFGTLRELREIAAGKATKEGKFGFTPPEQWQGKPVKQSDIFAIGATLYYLLTGCLPLSDEYQEGGKPQPSDYNPDYPPIRTKNPKVSVQLQAILQKALELDIKQRYSSAEELKQALKAKRDISITEESHEPLPATPGVKPVLGLNRISIDFGSVIPGASLSKHFAVQNIGTGALMGKIAATEPWLEVSPTIIDFEGYEKDFLVTVDASRLPANFHGKGYIDIQTNGGNARIEVKANTKLKKKSRRGWIVAGSVLGSITAIILMVGVCPSPPPPVLDVNTSTIYFNNLKPGLLEADSQSLTISNTGGQKLTGTLTTDKNWLRIGSTEIEVAKDAKQDVRVMVSTSDLKSKFSEWGYITLKTNGGEKQIPVYLTITSIIFEDDFSDANSGWNVDSDENAETKYESGVYRVVSKKSSWLGGQLNRGIGQFDDFVLEVDTKSMSSVKDSACAVVFRAPDVDNYYYFVIYPGYKSYQVGKFADHSESILIKWTESSYINGSSANNSMKVVCQGAQMKFYVNNQYLNTVTDYSFSKGYFGLGAVGGSESGSYSWLQTSTKADVLFDNLKISVP